MKRTKSTLSMARWLLASTLICGSAAVVTSCGNNTLEEILGAIDNPSGSTTVAVTDIMLDETSLTKIVGDDAVTLTATVNGDATDKTIVWKSDKPSVANVDANGVVTIQGRGLATITVTATNGTEDTADDKTATCEVAVYNLVNLATLNDNYSAQDFDMLTGTLANNVKISIAGNATVVLMDLSINASGTWTSGDYAGITCEGDATIILEGTNTVKGFSQYYPGIFPAVGKTLTIKGDGSLTVSSNGFAAGIGAGAGEGCGNIVIEGGTIIATGGGNGAGIGGANAKSCSNIEIKGGNITATGGALAAGIGSGGGFTNCGNITISGGTVEATGGTDGAGIGSGGSDSTCGNITISGGTVEATGVYDGAGIGSGGYSSSVCGDITITTGVISVTATKGTNVATASIGKGLVTSTCGTVTIGCTLDGSGNPVGGTVGAISDSPYTYPSVP